MESEKKIGIDDFICKVEIKVGVGELGNWEYTVNITYKIDI